MAATVRNYSTSFGILWNGSRKLRKGQHRMRRYRSKPVEVQAFQFDPRGDHRLKLPEGITAIGLGTEDNHAYDSLKFYATVQVGEHLYRQEIKPLDWIVITSDGVWRTCDRRSFDDGFERVEAP